MKFKYLDTYLQEHSPAKKTYIIPHLCFIIIFQHYHQLLVEFPYLLCYILCCALHFFLVYAQIMVMAVHEIDGYFYIASSLLMLPSYIKKKSHRTFERVNYYRSLNLSKLLKAMLLSF